MGVMEEVCGEEVLDVIGAAVEAFVRRLWVGINALYDEFDKFLMQCRERLAEAEKLQPDSAPVLLLRTDIPFVLWRVMPGTAADLVDGLPKLHIKGIPVRSELNHVEFQMRMARAFDRYSLLLALKDLPLLSRDNRTFFFEQINMLPNLEELLADPDNAGAGYLRKRSQAGAASEAAAMALAPAEALVAKDGVALLAADRVPPVEQAPSEPAVEAQAVDTGGAAAESAGETHASSPSAAAAASAASAEGAASSAVAVAAAAAAGSTPTAAGAGTNDERAKQPANAEQTSDAPAARGRKARGRKGQEAAGDEDESAAPAGAGSRKRRGTSVEADEPVRKKLRSA